MKPPEEVKLEFTREWVRKAEGDFNAAGHLLKGGEDYLFGTAFHAQQAAGKYLKAFLVWHQIEFPKTHDIAELAKQAARSHPDFAELEPIAAILTPYASAYRYPGGTFEPMPSREEFDQALQHAQTINDFVLHRLPPEARP